MQYVNGQLVMMHGEERGRSLKEPVFPYRGGIFGQPSLPLERTGIFRAKWALPAREQVDNTIGCCHNNLPDRYLPVSGNPVRGIIPKSMAGQQFPQIEGSIEGPRTDLSDVVAPQTYLVLGAGVCLALAILYFATNRRGD